MTTVNVNVTDASGQAWSNGTLSVQLQTAFGSHLNVPPVKSTLDASGNTTITLAPNLAITPPGSGWYFTVCPAASAPCFAKAYTISGATQSLNIVPPAIKINLESTRAVTLPIHATAYSSSEIAGAQIGSIYYDLTLQSLQVLQSLPSNWVAVGAGSAPPAPSPGATITAISNGPITALSWVIFGGETGFVSVAQDALSPIIGVALNSVGDDQAVTIQVNGLITVPAGSAVEPGSPVTSGANGVTSQAPTQALSGQAQYYGGIYVGFANFQQTEFSVNISPGIIAGK